MFFWKNPQPTFVFKATTSEITGRLLLNMELTHTFVFQSAAPGTTTRLSSVSEHETDIQKAAKQNRTQNKSKPNVKPKHNHKSEQKIVFFKNTGPSYAPFPGNKSY